MKNNIVKKKLDGVSIYTGLMILGGVIGTLDGIAWLLLTSLIFGLIILLFSVFGIIIAVELRNFKKWAWTVNMVWLSFLTFAIIVSVINSVLSTPTILLISIAPLWMIYFYKKREYFDNKKFEDEVK